MLRPTNAGNTMTFLTFITFNQWQSKPLVCMANPLPHLELSWNETRWHFGRPRERQWLHQRLSLAVERGNTLSILAFAQVWSDFSHPQCINQCSLFLLVSCLFSMNGHRLPNVRVFCELHCLQYFFMPSMKPPHSNVLLPFSAILTNLILIFFMYTTVLCRCLLFNLFVFCLCLCLFNPIWGCYMPGGTYTMVVPHHGQYNFTVFYISHRNVNFVFVRLQNCLYVVFNFAKRRYTVHLSFSDGNCSSSIYLLAFHLCFVSKTLSFCLQITCIHVCW